MKSYKRTLSLTIKDWSDLKPSLKDMEEWRRIQISSEELKSWIFLKPAERKVPIQSVLRLKRSLSS